MDILGFVVFWAAFIWGMIGAWAAISTGRGYMWRLAIWFGPLFYGLLP